MRPVRTCPPGGAGRTADRAQRAATAATRTAATRTAATRTTATGTTATRTTVSTATCGAGGR